MSSALLKYSELSSQSTKLGEEVDLKREFRNILVDKKLSTVFQPIYDIKTSQIYGLEALSRGPINSYFYSPIELFQFAENTGFLYPLEKLARELAFERSRMLINSGEKLFINISSHVVHDSNFTPGHTISLLKKYNLTPNDVVFEITERSAIHDFAAFREVLNHYRDQGFQIAVDDAGAGYSSLQAISELTPDFIKVDRSLISNVHLSDVKKHILEAFISFAKKMEITVIAEGIEVAEELHSLIDIGIDCAQGYFLARPNYPVSSISNAALKCIQHKNEQNLNKDGNTFHVQLNDKVVILDGSKIIASKTAHELLK